MSNMSYCRFENTFNDLSDCYSAMVEENQTINDLSNDEARAFRKMYELMKEFIQEIEHNELLELDDEDDDDYGERENEWYRS